MVDVSHLSSAAQLDGRREIALLPRLLRADEQVLDMCHGMGDGRAAAIVVTDRRIIYVRRRRFWGAHIESVPLARVRTAEEQIGVRHATVTVTAGGRRFELADVDRALAQTFCGRLRARLRE